MDESKKKVLWLADYDVEQARGGAQVSDAILIRKGRSLGYSIFKVNTHAFGPHIDVFDCDVLVSSNIESMTGKNGDLIDKISSHKYHVRLEHDSNTYLSQEKRVRLFSNCKKTFFLTDFHHEFFLNLYGDIFKNVEIVSDPVDPDVFCDFGATREDKTLISGYLHPLKGSYEFFEIAMRNPNSKFVLSGWTSHASIDFLARSIGNIEYIGITKHEDMPALYNKYKNFFYRPNIKEPFCRSIAEATFCGMEIVTDKAHDIGCLCEIKKYGIETFKSKCKNAADDFWNKI